MIEAQDMLLKMQIADYPNMTKSSRQKLHKEMHKKAYPSSFNESKKITNDELMRLING